MTTMSACRLSVILEGPVSMNLDHTSACAPRDTQAVSVSPTLMIVCPLPVRMVELAMIELPTTPASAHRDLVVTIVSMTSTNARPVLVNMGQYVTTM